MNKQLELFLNKLEFGGVCQGDLHYSETLCNLFHLFEGRYLPGVPIADRDEETELRLRVEVTKSCSIRCFVYTYWGDDIAATEFSMINATPGAIEEWILSIDFDAINDEATEPELTEVKV